MGIIPHVFRAMNACPEVVEATLLFEEGTKSYLDPKLWELAYLKASSLNGCQPCVNYHAKKGKQSGLTPEQLQAVETGGSMESFDDLEQGVLRFVEQWIVGGSVDSELVQRLCSELGESGLTALAATISLATWINQFTKVAEILRRSR
ncbi:MAG: carboxymuconolactone decarboxylase family protein [Gemmataceae bacterium]